MSAIGLLACATAMANPTPVSLPVYPLTNSLSGGVTNEISLANGLTFLSTGQVYTMTSQPFQIWPHHGFTINAGMIGTNTANTGNVNFTFRFASVHYSQFINGTAYVTNWTTANNLMVALPMNGTNEAFDFSNIQPTVIDNMSLGQLVSITNASTYGMNLDPTNLFIGVYP